MIGSHKRYAPIRVQTLARNRGQRSIRADHESCTHPSERGARCRHGRTKVNHGRSVRVPGEPFKRARASLNAHASRALSQPFIEYFPIDHPDEATFYRHIHTPGRRRHHASGARAGHQ
jgi:hypothetical protein